MAKLPAEPSDTLTESSLEEQDTVAGPVFWPWLLKTGLVLALAVIWVLLVAKPALGKF
jgi:hypothetical protein